ncbi:cytochrome P450 [Hypoxylon argillaceum]|nr:cytochrome P450 [Hypoxylon argillaceum]
MNPAPIEVFGRPIGVLAPLLFILLTNTYVIWFLLSRKRDGGLSSLPTIGTRNELFSWSRATLRSLVSTRDWAFEGYYKYSKSHTYYSIPSIDQGRVLVVPPRYIREVYSITDKRLDVHDTGNKTLQAQWTIWNNNIYENSFNLDIVRNYITRNLEIITPPLALELKYAFAREWGTTTTNWVEVRAWRSSLKIIAGVANAAFCGPPLCRNPAYLKWLGHHATCLFIGSALINCVPSPIKPLVGLTVAGVTHIAFRKAAKECWPIVQERLKNTALLKENPDYNWVPPSDGLQWIIEECYAKKDPKQLDTLGVCHRLIFLNDISMYSTAITAQNVILDLASSDPAFGYIEILRQECEAVLKEAGGSWTRQAVMKLKLVDSTIRESMRLRPVFSLGSPRTVIDPQGVNVSQGGDKLYLPLGTRVALPVEPIHHDESIYKDATSFHPFRFANPDVIQSIFDNLAFESDSPVTGGNHGQKAGVTLDDCFLGFGYGRSACPGRFFVMNEVKMFVAEMILNYDLEYLREGRSNLTPVIWLNVPLRDGKIRVRRRTGSHNEKSSNE